MAKVTTEKKPKEEGEVKKTKLDLAFEKFEKDYGKGAVISGNKMKMDIQAISTGSIALDAAIGIWGLPMGRIVDITAPESAGKTTLALHVIANAQKQGIRCAFIDMEHALSGKYAADLGVNMDKLIFSQPDYGEQALKIAETLVRTEEVGVIIIDSTASLVPKAEFDTGVGSPTMAGIGRIMSQALRVLTSLVHNSNCLLIFINQIRGNPGGFTSETHTGGNALKFYASVRLDIRRIKLDTGEDSSRTKIKVLKNKVGSPFKEVEIDLIWGKGFGKIGEIIDMSEELGLIVRAGSWYSQGETKLGQGRNAMIELLETNPEMAADWECKIIDKLKGN